MATISLGSRLPQGISQMTTISQEFQRRTDILRPRWTMP
jgi:hypothetical protein